MNRKRGRGQASTRPDLGANVYEGLPRDVEEEEAEEAARLAAAQTAGEAGAAAPKVDEDPLLSVKLTESLRNKLVHTAREEGVPLEALVQELLAEGVTLRAWEIIERKNAMRGGNTAAPQGGGNRFGGNQGNNRRHGNRNQQNRRGVQNNAWMEDKAAFLEYVRNQEKRRR